MRRFAALIQFLRKFKYTFLSVSTIYMFNPYSLRKENHLKVICMLISVCNEHLNMDGIIIHFSQSQLSVVFLFRS